MNATKIEWATATWNPIRGCTWATRRECQNCYAAARAARFAGPGQPFAGFATTTPDGPRWTGRVELVWPKLTEPIRVSRPQRIFTASMSDLGHPSLPDADLARVWAVMRLTPWHRFLVLTKRPGRLADFLTSPEGKELVNEATRDLAQLYSWKVALPDLSAPAPWIWIGTSASDQEAVELRVPDLLRAPAGGHFLSYEPALGPIFLRNLMADEATELDALTGAHQATCAKACGPLPPIRHPLRWIIFGGESGTGARPTDIDLARRFIDVTPGLLASRFVKQLGSQAIPLALRHRKGGDPAEWPEDLRVREIPEELLLAHERAPE